MSTQFVQYSPLAGLNTYPTFVSFPATAFDGSVGIALDTDVVYVYNAGSTSWLPVASPGSAFNIGVFDSGVASANGASINVDALILQSASASVPGLVNTGTQSFAGNKTFTGTVQSLPFFPATLGLVQLGTPIAPITAGSSYTYTIPLGGTYSELILTNFSWVNPSAANRSLPGMTLANGSFSQNDNGPMLLVTSTPGGWTRIFKITPPEYANNSGSNIAAPLYAKSGSAPVALGYGNAYLNVAFDNLELETTTPKKFQIQDAYISGTDLKIVVKNSEPVTTLNLNAYIGFSRIFGYLGQMYISSVANTGFIALLNPQGTTQNLWITEDGGSTFNNFPSAQTDWINTAGSYNDSGTYKVMFLTMTLNTFYSTSPSYSWAQNNLWTLTQGVNEYKTDLSGGTSYYGSGGKRMDAKASCQCMQLFYKYSCLTRLFKSVDNFVNIGSNSPTFDDGNPILISENVYTEQDVDSFQNIGSPPNVNSETYVRVVDGNHIYASFPFMVPYASSSFTVQPVADVGGNLASLIFFIYSAQYGPYYYVWMNVDGTTPDPTPFGPAGGIPVVFPADSSAVDIAAAIATAIATNPAFTTSVVSDVVTVTTVGNGPVQYVVSNISTPFTYNVLQYGYSLVNQALCKTTDGGTTWTKLLTAHPEFVYAISKIVNISDDGQTIVVAVGGNNGGGNPGLFPYSSGLYFNMSLDGGATFLYATGSWPLITTNMFPGFVNSTGSFGLAESILSANSVGNVVAVFRSNVQGNGTPSITRSIDFGATWSALVGLAPYPGFENQGGLQSDCNDAISAFCGPGTANTTAESFVYKGNNITTFTNWGAYGL